MSDWTGEPTRTLDELAAFDAMRRFLEVWYKRGGRSEDQIAGVLGSLNRTNHSILGPGAPLDIATWDDWREAVAFVLDRGSVPARDPLA